MLSSLTPLLYLQISPVIVVVRNLKTGAALSAVPELALSLDNPPKVLGVGNSARAAAKAAPQARLINPFAHPRTMISDFTGAEILIKAMCSKVLKKSLFSPSPAVVVHPMGNPDGGFTQVEKRAFRELALGSGARTVWVWTGRPLTDEEIKIRKTPADAGSWEA
jgi:rod shape-determining protein MreB and related proteins